MKEIKMYKVIAFILFNLIILNGYGQVKITTILDTVKVKSTVASRVNNKIKKAIKNHFLYLKERSYCLDKKSNIIIVDIRAFDTIGLVENIEIIDYTEGDNKENKYLVDVFIVRKGASSMRQLDVPSMDFYYYKYKGWDIYVRTQPDIKLQSKGREKYCIFTLKYRDYVFDEEGTLPASYINYSLDIREYEYDATTYLLDESSIR